MKGFPLSLMMLCIISCETKENTQQKIKATIIKNEIFEGYAISDPEQIHLGKAMQLLFKDSPLRRNIADSVANIINEKQIFNAHTNSITVKFHGGSIKDTTEIKVSRDLNAFKKRSFIVNSPKNKSYTFVSNTSYNCVIKTTMMTSLQNGLSAGGASNEVYTLDTINYRFYDKHRNVLPGFKGLKSYTAASIYKLSLRTYPAKGTAFKKDVIYNTAKQNASGNIPHSVRSEM